MHRGFPTPSKAQGRLQPRPTLYRVLRNCGQEGRQQGGGKNCIKFLFPSLWEGLGVGFFVTRLPMNLNVRRVWAAFIRAGQPGR
jgi:hypothetical protein